MPDPASESSRSGTPAGYGRRLLAFIIDGFACSSLARIFTAPPSLGYSLAVTLIFVVERVAFTALIGASFGQYVVRERVVGVDGSRATLGQALIRTALMLPLLIPVFLVGQDGRGMHDRAAGTDVVRL